MFKKHEQIVLTADVVEFMSLDGATAAVATVLSSQARHVTKADNTHARTVPAAV